MMSNFETFVLSNTEYSSVHLHEYLTAVQLYLFMLLGVCLRIMYLMLSVLPSPYSIHESANKVNRSGADVQVVSVTVIFLSFIPSLSS